MPRHFALFTLFALCALALATDESKQSSLDTNRGQKVEIEPQETDLEHGDRMKRQFGWGPWGWRRRMWTRMMFGGPWGMGPMGMGFGYPMGFYGR